MTEDTYIVICTDTDPDHGTQYYIATRRVFRTRAEAEQYAATVSASRTPIIVAGRWNQLRTVDDQYETTRGSRYSWE